VTVSVRNRLAGLDEAIAAVDAVSFDFFDTLFVRPLVDAEDAFDILGEMHQIEGFRALRRAAQMRAFQVMHEEKRGEINLGGIYRCFNTLPVPPERLQQAEYALELEITQPNPEMIALFHHALALGKKVVITSDMYLQAPYFHELMDRHGLPNVPLFISADRGATKRDFGALFDILAAELELPKDRILHIGDNAASDFSMGREKGLRTFHYREARVPPRRKGISPTASLARGLVRLHQEEVPPDTLRELGFLKGGPAALGFLDWIVEEAKRDGIEHILFVSRDGHVLQELAQRRRAAEGQDALPHSSYLLGSRVSFILSGMTEANFAAHLPFLLSGADDLSPAEVLERIGVPAPAEHVMEDLGLGRQIRLPDSKMGLMSGFLHAWRWEILKISRRNRRGLLRHLIDLGLRPGQRVAMVDVGWNGTTQEAFEGALRGLMPLEISGYYFCLTDSMDCRRRRQSMRMKALVEPNSVTPELLNAVYANRVAGEFFFSAPHSPIIGYGEGLQQVVAVEDPGRANIGNITAMAEEVEGGMVDFAERFIPWQRRLGLKPDPLGMAMPLLEFMADGNWAKHRLLRQVRNFDSWASSRNRDMWLIDYAVEGYKLS
jgi:predicted HAD superfamily hydrolase